MNRITDTFVTLRQQRRKAFVGYVMAGYPSPEAARSLAEGMLKQGADLLEIGVPFSDPLADGPVIQAAGEKALAQGATLEGALDLARELRRQSRKPLLIMTYYNPVLSLGLKEFAAKAAEAGVDGAIIPDLPPEEAGPLKAQLKARQVCLVLLAAPNSTPGRLQKIASQAEGFIYFVSMTGVTGSDKGFDEALGQAMRSLRKLTPLPLAIGFGVSTPEKAREAAGLADGVVVASAVIKEFQGQNDPYLAMSKALQKAKELMDAVHGQ
jgi:tryptophan synthase alpha chain